MKRPLEVALWCDCETDEEKAVFVKSGRAVDTGIIAPAISYEVGRMLAQSVRMKAALERCRDEFRIALDDSRGGHHCDFRSRLEAVMQRCEEALK